MGLSSSICPFSLGIRVPPCAALRSQGLVKKCNALPMMTRWDSVAVLSTLSGIGKRRQASQEQLLNIGMDSRFYAYPVFERGYQMQGPDPGQ